MANAQRQAQLLGSSGVSQVRRIPRNQIRRFPDQPRSYFDAKDMGDLAASIEEIGQQTPIVVKAITGDPKHGFELVDGERRWIACGMAGVDTMLAWVRPVADNDEQFVASVVGNFGRSGHTALEISQAIDRIRKSKRMQEFSPGEQVARIAKIFARSEPWVYSHLAILRLHPEVQVMMAPTIPEEERLSHSLGVFISGLHPDLQLEIAKVVVAKKMNINQARVQARQMAEEVGVQAGTAKRPYLPGDNYRSLQRFVQRTQEGVNLFLSPSMLGALQKRDSKDLALMATELEQCTTRLNELRISLMEPSPAVVIDIRSSNTRPSAVTPPSPPLPRGQKPAPVESSKEQPLELSHKILTALFYPNKNGQPYVDLSRRRIQEELPEILDLDVAMSKALRTAKDHWRIVPQGPEAKEKLIRLMHRFRHNYGNYLKFDEALAHARKWDESTDPVSLHFTT